MTENNKEVKDYIISREKVSNLYLNIIGDGISTYELSMWVKFHTNEEFVVVPRHFCLTMIEFVENEFEGFGITEKSEQKQFLKEVRNYL